MGSASKVGDSRHHLSTKDRQKIRENEKYERNYRQWQQAKAEVRQGQGTQLRERIALQHHLIRAQDELAHIKRDEEKQRIAQKRENEKAGKHAREEALLSICRQSLDEDRRSFRARKERPKSTVGNELPTEVAGVTPPSSLALVTERLRSSSTGQPNATSAFQRRTLSPFVAEDDDDEETDQSEANRKLAESLPWHHAQLYRLYGDKADYFLHPKIEPKPQKQLHPKLRNPCGGGAEVLWSGLREESMARLRRYDRHVPKELKSAFSAFVRQNLTKNVNLVRRHYCTEEDVPEMTKLLDKTLLHKAMAYRHKLQLMHRSSQTNADRTKVLTFNNPLPDLNNLEGMDGISRYLPSWLDEDVESVLEYEKWLQEGNEVTCRELLEAQEPDDLEEEGGHHGAEFASDYQPCEHQEEKPAYVEYPKLKFMVPTEPRSNGGFSVKFQDKEKTSALPPPREEMRHKERARSEPPRRENRLVRAASNRSDPRFTTKWQPLSMNALVEYTRHLDPRGKGHFRQGQTPMWLTQLPSQPALS